MATEAQKIAWINKIAPIAVDEYVTNGTGYFPSLLIAQSALETGWGVSPNCKATVDVNNVLGMKVSLRPEESKVQWTSCWNKSYGSILKKTPEVRNGETVYIYDYFRSYPTINHCLHDYCLWMHSSKYEGVTDLKTPQEVIYKVNMLGYSSNDEYYLTVLKIVNQYDLTRFDKEAMAMAINIIKINPWTKYNFSPRNVAPRYICIHYTANAFSTARQNANYYNGSVVNASADFFVDENDIIQLNLDIPHYYSWATGKKWFDGVHGATLWGIATIDKTISIEMCCKTHSGARCPNANSPDWYFEDGTVNNTIKLIRYLMKQYNIPIENVVRHYDICGKMCPGIVGWNEATGDVSKYKAFKEAIVNDGEFSDMAVKDFQQSLINFGFDLGKYGADGDFGADSKKATEDFQKFYGLDVTGRMDSTTVDLVKELNACTDPAIFDASYYVKYYSDLEDMSLAQAIRHWYKHGMKEGRRGSILLDVKFYIKTYEDLKKAFGKNYKAAIEHFLKNGMKEGRQGSEDFIMQVYRKNYADLRTAFGNDYEKYYRHYITNGIKEGRIAK